MQLNGGQFSTRNHKFSLSPSLLNRNQFRSDTHENQPREVIVDASRIIQSRHKSVENICSVDNNGKVIRIMTKADF